LPHEPLRGNITLFSHTMGCLGLSKNLRAETATTGAAPVAQRRSINSLFLSTITATKPLPAQISQCCPSSKALIGYVLEGWHTLSLLYRQEMCQCAM
jgi:hypothetical protein